MEIITAMLYNYVNYMIFAKERYALKIVIVGGGKIGTAIIESLVREGHDLTVVDNNQEVISEIGNLYDVMCVCGNAADYDTLAEAQVASAEMVVAVTSSDELNMLTCFLAKRMGAKNTVARIRNPEFNDSNLSFMKQQLDISLSINPELLVAQEFFNILRLPGAVNIETFSRRNFEMVELNLKPDSPLDGMRLMDLRKKYKVNFLVGIVRRGDEIFIPDGNFVLKGGDHIGLTATFSQVQKLLKVLGIARKQSKSVMVLGASTTSYYLAKMLLAAGSEVTIIEKDREKCNRFAELLPGAVIINGDGAHQDLLLEEGIASTDAFVTLTGMDEENILISFFASSQNVPRVVTKVNRPELATMSEKLGLDSVISPKRTVSGVITRYARALHNSLGSNVETLYKLMDGRVEALEFNVQPDFKMQRVPLKEMKLKKDILIAGIIRKRKAFIPSGDDEILAGDKIIVIAKATDDIMNDLSDILR